MKKIYIKYLIISVIVILIACFHISRKENLDIDEVYTYGLANNTFQLDIEDYKNYTGDELLTTYATVDKDNRFDIDSVFFNQSMDTHPPLYYILVNFICSLFYGKFSMWFGLSINILAILIIFWEISYIIEKITNNKVISVLIPLISLFTYGFTNLIVFTRMYAMLTAISLYLIILILNKTSENNTENIVDTKFLVTYYITCLAGILTQYHFVITMAFFTIYLLINLLINKKYKMLLTTSITAILSIITSIIIFPSMLNHIFGNSLHAFSKKRIETLITNFNEIGYSIITSFFGKALIAFIIILIIALIISIIKKIKPNKVLSLFLVYIIFYYIIVCITAQFSFARYLYNIYPIIIILLTIPIYKIYKSLYNPFAYISVLLLTILCIMSNTNKTPSSLNKGDILFENFLKENKDVQTILMYRSMDDDGNENTMGTTSKWKLPRPLYTLRNMENIVAMDISDKEKAFNNDTICNHDDMFVLIYTTENDNVLLNRLMKLNNVNRYTKIYFCDYYHMYLLYQD